MCTIEWKEVTPEQSDWIRQIDILAYYGSVKLGSIILYDDERTWHCVIDGYIDYLDANTEEDAKAEMKDKLDNFCTDQINYYTEIQESICELN